MPFTAPSAPTGGVNWADHKGALVIVEPESFEEGIATAYGKADAVRATVHVIEGPGAPATYSDTLIFPKLLVSQTRKEVGKQLLARLGQGQQKPGQSPPWLLDAATAADMATAEKWLASNPPEPTFATPSAAEAKPPWA